MKGLEVVTAAYLSRDPVLIDELINEVDIHGANQDRFGFPKTREGRTVAKILKFRIIYGGGAYAFSVDPDFMPISDSVKFWEGIIEEYYKKYSGIRQWHDGLVKTVQNTGKLVMPTGREYDFDRLDVVRRLFYWRPKILNYPVQGLGADLVALGRVATWKRLRKAGIPTLWQSTVHDSIDIDCPNINVVDPLDGVEKPCYTIVCRIVNQAINDVPLNFERMFGPKFDLPLKAEIKFGHNLEEMDEYLPS